MPKTHKWGELKAKMSPTLRAEVDRRMKEELAKTPLYELRTARHLTQQQIAKTLNMSQAAVSQMEQRTDLYLSTLRNFIEAMGGELEIHAVFADTKVELTFEQDQ
jgi:DNA-binding XRE family transcriptional regulator